MKKSSILITILYCEPFLVGRGVGLLRCAFSDIVRDATYDFGEVQANQTLTHTFVLKNIGDSVLRAVQQATGGKAAMPRCSVRQ